MTTDPTTAPSPPLRPIRFRLEGQLMVAWEPAKPLEVAVIELTGDEHTEYLDLDAEGAVVRSDPQWSSDLRSTLAEIARQLQGASQLAVAMSKVHRFWAQEHRDWAEEEPDDPSHRMKASFHETQARIELVADVGTRRRLRQLHQNFAGTTADFEAVAAELGLPALPALPVA
jgi:hypothetical protein